MAESNMSISVNGHSQVPPGFRFHPTEEELLQYYLKKKVSNLRIDLDVIRDIDLNKLEPWDIREKCRIGTTPQNDWYFFSHKDKKYPTGTRTNRATVAGFWKATGRDKAIFSCGRRIGMRKTLVFYEGRAPHGRKSDWIMHEYRLDYHSASHTNSSNSTIESTQEEGWVVCRIFKKKSHSKTRDDDDHRSPDMISSAETRTSNEIISASEFNDHEGTLEQIFQCMRSRKCCKEETIEDKFSKLPRLESPNSMHNSFASHYHDRDQTEMIGNWTALDRLVASEMNGQDHDQIGVPHATLRASSSSSTLNNMINPNDHIYYSNEDELWGFARSSSSYSSSDPISHFSNCQL